MWKIINLFWFDILNLTNGIFFLFLIKSMALATIRAAAKKPKKARVGSIGEITDYLGTDGSRPNHGTKSVLEILGDKHATKRSAMSPLINAQDDEDYQFDGNNAE